MMTDRFQQQFERGQTIVIETSNLPIIDGVVLAVEDISVVGDTQQQPRQKLRLEISLEVPLLPIPVSMSNVVISRKELVKDKEVISAN